MTQPTTSINQVLKHRQHTPSDTEELSIKTRSIVIVAAGDVSITDRDGTTLVYPAVPAYTTFTDFAPLRINATGTTSTDIRVWEDI